MYAWLVWKYGIIGFSVREGEYDPETSKRIRHGTVIKRAPISPGLLTPLLVGSGILFILAGTPTGLGQTLVGPLTAAVALYHFLKDAWSALLFVGFVIGIVTFAFLSLVRREWLNLIVAMVLAALKL
jgi:hypothetical protein